MKYLTLNSHGFSLIEMLVVIIVVGILAGVALQSMTATIHDARQIKTEREMVALANGIVGDPGLTQNGRRSDFGYVGDIGAFPVNLQALLVNPGGYATWDGPYIRRDLTEDSIGYRTDEWGVGYSYSGGIIISSTGSGATVNRKIADATSDYLLNTINGTILDAADSPPGVDYVDSVAIEIVYPNGSGGTAVKSYRPEASGAFRLDSIPVGSHPMRLIYEPNVDTLQRYLTVLPRHKSEPSYRFASAYFGGTGPSGSGSEILRPEAAGSMTNMNGSGCGANWDCVNDAVADDGTTYVETPGNNWDTELYTLQDHSVGSGTIDSIKITIRIIDTHSSSRGKTAILTNGALYLGPSENPSGSWTEYGSTYAGNPETGTAWTWADIDALEAGIEMHRGTQCTQVWVEVFYTD